jgi:NAD(P)-dependent dehydrogenase (short-subunit alcohol dehydrogenase family)
MLIGQAARSLDGRIVVVTGAFGALGRTVASGLTDRGAKVVAVDVAPAPPAALAAEWVLPSVDLGDEQSVENLLARIGARHEMLQGLVNIAGGFTWETISQGRIETWDRLYAVNVRTAVLATRAALPLLVNGKGSIVNVGAAAAANRAGLGMAPYAAAKAAVAKFTESLAEELKDAGVRVNAVLPSIIDTPANRAEMPDADFSRWVSPAALEKVIAFLLSDDSKAISGACLPVLGRV